MVKTVSFVRLLSIFLFIIIISLVYAYLPVQVRLFPEAGSYSIHRENFFYYTAVFFLLVNIIVWLLLKMTLPGMEQRKGEETAAWFSGLPVVINLYIIFLAGFVGVINNSTHIKASSYGYLNFMGPFLFFIWIAGLIYFYVVKNHRIHNQ